MSLRNIFVCSLVAVLISGVCFSGSDAVAAEKKVVTVNIQKVLLDSSSGQAVKKVLEEKVAEFQKNIQADQEEVEKMRAEIEKKSSVWSEQVREEKERDYQKKVRELQLKSEDAQFELQQLEKQVMEPVVEELKKVIADMGEKNGYDMILDSRAGLLYVNQALDISDKVKKELDARQSAKN